MQKPDLLRLIESIHGALCAGGMPEDLAAPFTELAKNLAGLLPDEFALSKPKDAGLVALLDTIDLEWKRSSTNLRALLLTTLRDKPEAVARIKIEKLLELHLRFELVMLQSLLDAPPGRGGPREDRQGGRPPASPGQRPLPRRPRERRPREGRPPAR